ncbi:IclR family transcriptional regulator domain-containing protein [Roseinatronobacter alkalisoli]|uniref:DNA-binding transcriptional regulator KdgR n=1 Tax=Roseinatronobacter alkalisoli TaxID=3028235 RepID=A0ABT5T765_9RHOB|nr:IclR family transcriptional regulator C-terminal domain-containing protein [Roseinatronobacter sp. HJB301]MDD7970973.1 DNA-binding transcriptional regulator KdgR [Roseinatronobacter sp. HJB301]
MAESVSKTENVAAALKVFAVLEALVQDGQVSLADLAKHAMTSKATAHRLLHTMIDLGYVEQDSDTERFRLTLKLFSLGARSLNGQSDLLRVADLQMGRLSRATGESINLGILDEREQKVAYIHKYDSAYSLSMKSTLGLRNPLHSTSLGKALLAWRPEEEVRDRLGQGPLPQIAPRTVTDVDALIALLRQYRSLGVAEEIEESEAGVRCMAVPVLDHMGRSVAAISIAFPIFRFEDARRSEYVALLIAAGEAASHALGFEGSLTGPSAQGIL